MKRALLGFGVPGAGQSGDFAWVRGLGRVSGGGHGLN